MRSVRTNPVRLMADLATSLKPHRRTNLGNLARSGAAGERGGGYRTGADARDTVYRDISFFEYLQHTGMSEASREAPAECKADSDG